MTDKELKRLSRSELLEIILMLKENEKKLQEENKKLSEKLSKISKQISVRRKALASDNALGNSFDEMDKAYETFKSAAVKFRVLLEESGSDVAQSRDVGENSNE